ncbi:sarcolemmal membrane-associated protein isoform X2 [Nilaparvata lugens]|uniref:sarcolemmal membrane-associated protein isoform X2 n=1 Tax=Nilaparvata lugens TaxID=108931 RepID=UPI00193DB7A2|nr:sarcolemmal membrane-associated protein isoform X2 [Nilaparvata lugens]
MVVSGGRKENYTIPYTNNTNNEQMTENHKMAGKAVLLCRPNSHPFQDRTFVLDQPVKIGRSVARARPSPNNGIFDCKVLSRNHAIFWYSNGKFYLQDTKSSNGTFVNNQRLGKSGEDSQPREVCSGDIVQFGVEVLENSRKVTHGCIVANLKLYLPDGKGAKCSPSIPEISSNETVPIKDLYKLNQNIQEALQREHTLRKKIYSLQEMIAALKQSAECGWKTLISEDRLLSRVETLENQLRIYSKNFSDDKLREELRKLHDDKNVYQSAAKDYLRKALEEKLEAVNRCQQLELKLTNREAECAELKEASRKIQKELQDLAQTHGEQMLKLEALEAKLEETIEQHNVEIKHLEFQNDEYRMSLEKALENGHCLQQRIDHLESVTDLDVQQIMALQKQLQNSLPNHNLKNMSGAIIENENEKLKDVGLNELIELREKLNRQFDDERVNNEYITLLHAQLEIMSKEKLKKIQEINSMEAIVESFSDDVSNCREEKKMIEDVINSLPPKIEKVLDLPIELRARLGNSLNESEPITKESLLELLAESRAKTETAEKNLASRKAEVENTKESLAQATNAYLKQNDRLLHALQRQKELETSIKVVKEQIESMSFVMNAEEKKEEASLSTNKDIEQIESLKRQLLDAQQAAKQTHNEMKLLRDRLNDMESTHREQELSADQLRRQLPKTLEQLNEAHLQVTTLKSGIHKLETSNLLCKGEVDKLKQQLAAATEKVAQIREEERAQSTGVIESLEKQICDMREELIQYKEQYVRVTEEKSNLTSELHKVRTEYESLTHHPYFHTMFAMPLMILIVGTVIKFYPWLSSVFGTADSSQPDSSQ